MKHLTLDNFHTFAESFFDKLECPSHTLLEAMRYSFFSGGKRIRAQLVYIIGDMFDIKTSECHKIAMAIELIHTYSLVHDDLPAMDNDILRRGKPTCHVKFNEATAILAGDSLQALAFQAIQEINVDDINTLKKLNTLLAQCSGANGMVAGQQLDLEGENKALDIINLETVHINKTARMFSASILMPYFLSKNIDIDIVKTLEKISLLLGLSFQIKDDILDVTKSTSELGKTSAKDIISNKSTYVSLLGLENATVLLNDKKLEIYNLIIDIENRGFNCDELKNIINLVIDRNY
ncbi:polyprenyl synthetase family protein [Francisellaceae bacterium CB300]|jgi:farnesyl diphosphate synthase